MSRKSLLLIALVVAVAVVCIAAGSFALLSNSRSGSDAEVKPNALNGVATAPTTAPSDPSVQWNVPAGTLSADDENGIRAALAESASIHKSVPVGRSINIMKVAASGSAAVLYGDMRSRSTSSPAGIDPMLILASRSGDTWTLVPEGDGNFCNALRSTPDSILSPNAKSYFIGC
jgi:hypothetical protein